MRFCQNRHTISYAIFIQNRVDLAPRAHTRNRDNSRSASQISALSKFSKEKKKLHKKVDNCTKTCINIVINNARHFRLLMTFVYDGGNATVHQNGENIIV